MQKSGKSKSRWLQVQQSWFQIAQVIAYLFAHMPKRFKRQTSKKLKFRCRPSTLQEPTTNMKPEEGLFWGRPILGKAFRVYEDLLGPVRA